MFRLRTLPFVAVVLTAVSFILTAPAQSAPSYPSALPPAVPIPSTVGKAVGKATVAAAGPRRDLPASRLTNRRALLSRRAMTFRNARYRFGAANPRATDCSGLTMQLYRSVGIKLPHSARGQFGHGKSVSKAGLLPGDLVFFNTGRGRISHVGMYIGEGKMIHAANPRKDVRIDSISGSYYGRRYVGARRLLKEGAPMPTITPEVVAQAENPKEIVAALTGTVTVLQ